MELSQGLLLNLGSTAMDIVRRAAWNDRMGAEFSKVLSDAIDTSPRPVTMLVFVSELEFCLAFSAGKTGSGHLLIEIIDSTLTELIDSVDSNVSWFISQCLRNRQEVRELVFERINKAKSDT